MKLNTFVFTAALVCGQLGCSTTRCDAASIVVESNRVTALSETLIRVEPIGKLNNCSQISLHSITPTNHHADALPLFHRCACPSAGPKGFENRSTFNVVGRDNFQGIPIHIISTSAKGTWLATSAYRVFVPAASSASKTCADPTTFQRDTDVAGAVERSVAVGHLPTNTVT